MNNLNNPEIKSHEIQFNPSKFPNFTNHATKKHIKKQNFTPFVFSIRESFDSFH
jgi:hypothetical protein